MRRTRYTLLLALLACASPIGAQVLEETLVPAGRLRLQAYPSFTAWDTRFGRAPDGSVVEESLSDDLTDPTTLRLFPGIPTLTRVVSDIGGLSGYTPVLGATTGYVAHDATRIDFGGHLGVFDWLTIGVVVPWLHTRTALDVDFAPDSAAADLGLNPLVLEAAQVDAFLSSTATAQSTAAARATSICAGAGGGDCATAEALAARAADFDASLRAAYDASPFFPLLGTPAGDGLSNASNELSNELTAAGLAGLAPLVLATASMTEDNFSLLPTAVGAGIEASPLETRRGLWGVGDIEVSARVRLLDNITPAPGRPAPGFGYRLSASFLARLPTGEPEDPDILLDVGRGDGQADYEAGVNAVVRLGTTFGITMGGYYGIQGPTTLTKRVVAPEVVFAPLSTRTEVRWEPGFYVGAGIAPSLSVGSTLSLSAEYRFFHKGRDVFELTMPDPALDPVVLMLESGVKAHMVGGGIRYDTVEPWRRGDTTHPMEVHLRWLTTIRGSGGQTPKSTRIEAGLRLFRRFWGRR